MLLSSFHFCNIELRLMEMEKNLMDDQRHKSSPKMSNFSLNSGETPPPLWNTHTHTSVAKYSNLHMVWIWYKHIYAKHCLSISSLSLSFFLRDAFYYTALCPLIRVYSYILRHFLPCMDSECRDIPRYCITWCVMYVNASADPLLTETHRWYVTFPLNIAARR